MTEPTIALFGYLSLACRSRMTLCAKGLSGDRARGDATHWRRIWQGVECTKNCSKGQTRLA